MYYRLRSLHLCEVRDSGCSLSLTHKLLKPPFCGLVHFSENFLCQVSLRLKVIANTIALLNNKSEGNSFRVKAVHHY